MVKAMFMGETNISMDDDDMNYLVKAVIKGENNISIKILQDSGILWNTLAYTDILWHTLAYSCIL